ncbi:kinase-like protein [Wolfiporia cocos MD-104 SS10]|uniref:Kinase-like protein n=1 Tax=Wolfiporia cocos (strain MD-104) TaxID=742152 RepID=A0A2H3JYI6_WOLCO|nr:kinase-like protein [Wolfiporia cocos MD-104 SS10]
MSHESSYASQLVPDLTGKTIDDGCLQFVEKLGEGGYGVVYRAVDTLRGTYANPSNPKQYAVKVQAKAKPDTRRWQLQQREVINHMLVSGEPGVLTLHEVIEDEGDDFVYLIEDYCPGGDLFSAIVQRHMYCFNDALVKKVFVQILDAVQACHNRGVFHRDLKPDNIFCTTEDASEIVLGDFGLSTRAKKSKTFGCGSRNYTSPECIGEEVGFRPYSTRSADVWALGIILTNMIAGRSPWEYATTEDQYFLRFMHFPNFLREMMPVSHSANAILRRIFTLDPDDRITIPKLREAILKVDTFFMTPDEIARSNRVVQIVAATYSQPMYSLSSEDIIALHEEQAEFNKTENMIEGVIVANSKYFQFVQCVGTTASALNDQYDSDSDSGEESAGPVTPATHAQEPDILIEVPDMLEGGDLGIPVISAEEKKLAEKLPVESLLEKLENLHVGPSAARKCTV